MVKRKLKRPWRGTFGLPVQRVVEGSGTEDPACPEFAKGLRTSVHVNSGKIAFLFSSLSYRRLAASASLIPLLLGILPHFL
jgi:hypothetical protein